MWFQSTLPQGKWLKRKEQLKLSKSISIHTSAREVTEDMKGFVDFLKISIHTSAREVTQPWCGWFGKGINFNPHFRKGSDNPFLQCCSNFENFNPHFRKGSDSITGGSFTQARNFNPHFRKGSDWNYHKCRITTRVISIHTSAREVTKQKKQTKQSYRNFNPHFRKGSDSSNLIRADVYDISIHTSAREVTGYGSGKSYLVALFQSTLPQGKWL